MATIANKGQIGTILVMDSSAANALPEPRIILVARSVVEIFLLVIRFTSLFTDLSCCTLF
jgi:hypothetical protein